MRAYIANVLCHHNQVHASFGYAVDDGPVGVEIPKTETNGRPEICDRVMVDDPLRMNSIRKTGVPVQDLGDIYFARGKRFWPKQGHRSSPLRQEKEWQLFSPGNGS